MNQSWGTQERILVCITPRSQAKDMVESGRRNADLFHGQLFAVYVEQRDLSRPDEEMVNDNLELAEKLGAEVHKLEGPDPICEIIAFARQHKITQIFVGHSKRNRWKFWAESPLDRIIKSAEGIDVRIFPHTA
jgi:two-component system sensor histidine kinase KdpD